MLNVGLRTGTLTPRARQAPRTKVVLPAPRSPSTSTTSPGRSRRASSAPRASVSPGPLERCEAITPPGCAKSQSPSVTATVFGTVTPAMTDSRPQRRSGALAALRARYEPQLAGLRGSGTATAAGLAGAMIANNIPAPAATVLFAQEHRDYGFPRAP